MANTKSAEKAAKQSRKRQAANRIYIGGARTSVKKARVAINGDAANADAAVRDAISTLDRAATKGVIHKNNASRRKSRLQKALNKAQAAA
jgi:small subunit ribosomal protein S20